MLTEIFFHSTYRYRGIAMGTSSQTIDRDNSTKFNDFKSVL